MVWHLISVHDPGDFERSERELADCSARWCWRRGHGRDHPGERRAEPDRAFGAAVGSVVGEGVGGVARPRVRPDEPEVARGCVRIGGEPGGGDSESECRHSVDVGE